MSEPLPFHEFMGVLLTHPHGNIHEDSGRRRESHPQSFRGTWTRVLHPVLCHKRSLSEQAISTFKSEVRAAKQHTPESDFVFFTEGCSDGHDVACRKRRTDERAGVISSLAADLAYKACTSPKVTNGFTLIRLGSRAQVIDESLLLEGGSKARKWKRIGDTSTKHVLETNNDIIVYSANLKTYRGSKATKSYRPPENLFSPSQYKVSKTASRLLLHAQNKTSLRRRKNCLLTRATVVKQDAAQRWLINSWDAN